jgi:hypothetical protein
MGAEARSGGEQRATSEWQLLGLGVAGCLGEEVDADRVKELCGQVNWHHVLWLGRQQRVLLALHSLREFILEAVRGQVEQFRQANHLRRLNRAGEMCLIQDVLTREGLRGAFANGWALSERYYRTPDLRELGTHTSVVIAAGDRARAEAVFGKLGYDFDWDPTRLLKWGRTDLNFLSDELWTGSEAVEDPFLVWPERFGSFEAFGRKFTTLSALGWLSHFRLRKRHPWWRKLQGGWDVRAVLLGVAEGERWSVVRGAVRAGRGAEGEMWAAQQAANASALVRLRQACAGQGTTRSTFRVQFSPTSMDVVLAMLSLAEVERGDVVYDLGCGDGRFVVEAARRFGARGVGIDVDRKLLDEASAGAAAAGVGEVSFRCADFFDVDLGDATVVCLYLQPWVMPSLLEKLRRELRPGTRVVSHEFFFPGWVPERTQILRVRPDLAVQIYLWRV